VLQQLGRVVYAFDVKHLDRSAFSRHIIVVKILEDVFYAYLSTIPYGEHTGETQAELHSRF
jgi:hypothetical protein